MRVLLHNHITENAKRKSDYKYARVQTKGWAKNGTVSQICALPTMDVLKRILRKLVCL